MRVNLKENLAAIGAYLGVVVIVFVFLGVFVSLCWLERQENAQGCREGGPLEQGVESFHNSH